MYKSTLLAHYNGLKCYSMGKEDWQKQITELVKFVGEEEAVALLIQAKASPSIADKLVANRYPSRPGRLVRGAIHEAWEAGKQRAS